MCDHDPTANCLLYQPDAIIYVAAHDLTNPNPRAWLGSGHMYAVFCCQSPQMGIEPTIPGLGGQCLIH